MITGESVRIGRACGGHFLSRFTQVPLDFQPPSVFSALRILRLDHRRTPPGTSPQPPIAMFTQMIQGRREEKGFPCKREGSVLWLTLHPNSPHTELKEWSQMRRENQLLYQYDQLGASWSSRAPPAGFSVSRHRHQRVPCQVQHMSSNFRVGRI